MVSSLAFKIIKNAVKIRVDRGEDTPENIVAIYNKLSDAQAQEILADYTKKEA